MSDRIKVEDLPTHINITQDEIMKMILKDRFDIYFIGNEAFIGGDKIGDLEGMKLVLVNASPTAFELHFRITP